MPKNQPTGVILVPLARIDRRKANLAEYNFGQAYINSVRGAATNIQGLKQAYGDSRKSTPIYAVCD